MHKNKRKINKKKLAIYIIAITLTLIIAVAGIIFIVNNNNYGNSEGVSGTPPIYQDGAENGDNGDSTLPSQNGGNGYELPFDPSPSQK